MIDTPRDVDLGTDVQGSDGSFGWSVQADKETNWILRTYRALGSAGCSLTAMQSPDDAGSGFLTADCGADKIRLDQAKRAAYRVCLPGTDRARCSAIWRKVATSTPED